MYAPSYGFSQGASSNAPQPGYNPNGGPPSQQTPTPQQQLQNHNQQQQQHMMYNPQQQYGQGSPYAGGAPQPNMNPAAMQMGAGVANTGMMPNGGMAHMPPANNGIAQPYQTPYTSSPYGGAGLPNSSTPLQQQQQQPYMPPSSGPQGFNMNQQSMTPQSQMHNPRMQPPPVGTPIPSSQRVSPYGGAGGPQNTPPHSQTPSQFMTPQSNPMSNHQQNLQNQTPIQTQNQNISQQGPLSASGQATPQTPSFPPNASGAANSSIAVSTPLSPGSESREKERVTILLDINRELLMEVMRLQELQAEGKKQAEGEKSEKSEKPEKPVVPGGKDFVECMRRLQANLAYLAAIADRSHKPSSQIPPHPAIISAPPLALLSKSSPKPKSEAQSLAVKEEGAEPEIDRADTLKAQYARLQALFPGVDPKKEPVMASSTKQQPNQNSNTGAGAPNAAQSQNVKAQAQAQAQRQPGAQQGPGNMAMAGMGMGALPQSQMGLQSQGSGGVNR